MEPDEVLNSILQSKETFSIGSMCWNPQVVLEPAGSSERSRIFPRIDRIFSGRHFQFNFGGTRIVFPQNSRNFLQFWGFFHSSAL